MFEMAAPIQSPAKCEVRSVIRFLNAKCELPAEIHKQIVAVYGNVMNRQSVTKWCHEFSEGRTDVHDEQRSGRPSLISDDLLLAADFYDSGIWKLVPRLNKCLDNAGDCVEKQSYVQAVHSRCRFCKLKMLYMFKTFVSLVSGHGSYLVTISAVSPAEVHAIWNEMCKDSYELMWTEEILCCLEVIPWQFPFRNCERYGLRH